MAQPVLDFYKLQCGACVRHSQAWHGTKHFVPHSSTCISHTAPCRQEQCRHWVPLLSRCRPLHAAGTTPVCACCCRHASHFIAAQGMLALASVLSLLRPPKSVVRFAITAAELLTRSAGALACEAALGWFEPAELSDETVQAAQATAASLGARQRR